MRYFGRYLTNYFTHQSGSCTTKEVRVAGLNDEWVNRSGLAIDFMAHFDFGDALAPGLSGTVEGSRLPNAARARRLASAGLR
jgi:hypothetical protein